MIGEEHMNNTTTKTEPLTKEVYNNIPVSYCKECLSLKIRSVASLDAAYCEDCGGTDIAETHIEEWDKLYKNKYGFTYLNNSY